VLLLFAPLGLSSGILDFLLLLFDEKALHRVVVVMVAHKFSKLDFFREHRPPLVLFFLAIFVVGNLLAFLAHDVLPANLVLLQVFVIPGFIPSVIYRYQSPSDLRTAKVIHGQISTPLVFILEPAEALGLSSLLVACKLEKYGFAELGEDCDDVAFGQLVRQAAKVDIGCVAVVYMP
jgi:hypothetical protein